MSVAERRERKELVEYIKSIYVFKNFRVADYSTEQLRELADRITNAQ